MSDGSASAVPQIPGHRVVDGPRIEDEGTLVYRAFSGREARQVTVRVLREEAARDPVLRLRFEAERRAGRFLTSSEVSHPHLLPMYPGEEFGPESYQLLPYVEGGRRLVDCLPDFQPGVSDALRLVRGVASAVDFVHQRGVLHGNLNPANIMLRRDGTPLVRGFTVSPLEVSQPPPPVCPPSEPAYTAPELLREGRVSPASDSYSLACLLYELLVGQPPFSGGTVAVRYQQLHLEPPPASSIKPELKWLDPILERALSRDPSGRYVPTGELVFAAETAFRPAPPLPREQRPRGGQARSLQIMVVVGCVVAVPLAGGWLARARRDGVTLAPAPAVPTRLLANQVSRRAACLTWQGQAGIESYRITRVTAEGERPSPPRVVETSETSLIDSGLQPATRYHYTVLAVENGSVSPAVTLDVRTPAASDPEVRWERLQNSLDGLFIRLKGAAGPGGDLKQAARRSPFPKELASYDAKIQSFRGELELDASLFPGQRRRRLEAYCYRELGINEYLRSHEDRARNLLQKARTLYPQDRTTRKWLAHLTRR